MEFLFEKFGKIGRAGKSNLQSDFRNIAELFFEQLRPPFQAVGQNKLIGGFPGQGLYFSE